MTPPIESPYNPRLPAGVSANPRGKKDSRQATQRLARNQLINRLKTVFIASGISRLVMLQLLLIAVTSVVFFMLYGGFQAGSAAFGGVCACANRLLLEWRRYQADRGQALNAGQSIRLLYRTALERFVLVGVMFALGLGVWQMDPLALLTGFIVGQMALVFTGTGKTN